MEVLRQEGVRRESVFNNNQYSWEAFQEDFHSSIKKIEEVEEIAALEGEMYIDMQRFMLEEPKTCNEK